MSTVRAALTYCLLASGGCGASVAAPPAEQNVQVGRFPVDLAAGDLDDDRHLDLISADAKDRRLSVRLWRRGTYRAARAVSLPIQPHMLALADVDRDGDLDIAATGHDVPGIYLFLGDGRGGFKQAARSPFAAHAGARGHNHGLEAGDLDGDGDPDLVTANQDLGSVSILFGNGAGGFTSAFGSPIAVGRSPYPLALADVDGSGSLDIVVPLVGDNAVAVLLNDGRGRFRPAPGSPHATLARPYGVAVTDLDGDNRLDVVVAHDDTDVMTVLRGDGTGRLRETARFSAGQRPARLAAADLDGDGDMDVAAGAGDRILFLAGDGRGRLSAGPALLAARQSWTAIAADLDGDGATDVAAPDAQANAIRIHRAR